jgi:hypothetical protein
LFQKREAAIELFEGCDALNRPALSHGLRMRLERLGRIADGDARGLVHVRPSTFIAERGGTIA